MATQRMSLREFFAYQRNEMITYRITPHSNVTNNQNAKMWRVLHKMYEIYDRMPTRLTREGFRFTMREKDTIWFDVVFRQVAGVKSVEYYVSTSQIWAKKFREIVENFMHVTVEVADKSALVVPAGNEVTLNELRLARHDIFALQTNAAEQTSPVASILTALDDIAEDGDYARLSVCSETLDRRKWSQNASYAHEKLTKGKVPQRAKLTADKAYKTLGKALATMLNEIYDIVNDTLHAISNVFFKSAGGFEKRKAIDKPDALIEEIQANKLSAKSADKINQAVWKSHVRVVASTKEILRGQLVANTISSAFGELAGNNELVPFKVRMKARKQEILDELNTLHLSARTRADGDVSLLSCDELAKVALQMPTAIVQQRYEEELATNRRVETDLPKVMLHKPAQKYVEIEGIRISIGECNITRKGADLPVNRRKINGILVGHSEVRGIQYPIGLPTNNLDETFRSYGLVGAPRMGKDTLAKNVVIEGALQHDIASFVIDAIMEDGERGFADGVRDSLPPDRIIDIDLSDAEYPVPMDLTEIVEQLGANGANRFAQELIDFFGDMESMGQSRAILREFAKASGGSLFAIKRLLEDEGYRAEKANELRQQGNVRTAEFIEKYTSEWGVDAKGNPKLIRDGQKAIDGKASAILNRLDEMLGDDMLFRIFAQPASADIDFANWIREGKVVILRVPNRKLGALSAKTLIHWITLKIFMTKLLMDPNDGGAFIVFNEPHQFLTPGLKALMQRIVLEGPKWRLAGIFAFHHFDLLRYGLDDDLISGGINWFLFANDNRKVFERLEAQLKPTFDVDLALRIEAYDAIVLARFGGRRQNAFLMRALPPASQRVQQYDNSFLTKRHSRMYGRHWQTVEKLLASGEV
ncbi:AAA-like domain [Niallia circulans]|uniref:hypothetical protein n=1 Tax=Niallia circulans TaxID=1397 RepID=UPI00077C40AD|nr:hypothetical protein [Niallia circulans]MDR4318658.1 ATP-binding protein [Niallia circulans]MED3839381.1 ATP-binding protein [Niallia circulans]MED4245364.1 ATP-binding protein [Niallia circulans]MED4250899.1 ATP-binding protein [Niallia circulans]QKH60177.1 ATP-binding protein [Niallia circulans]